MATLEEIKAYTKPKKEQQNLRQKFEPSKQGTGIKKKTLASKYVPGETAELARTLKEWVFRALTIRREELFNCQICLSFQRFAGGFIPNFLDVYRGVKVGRRSSLNVDDVFRGGKGSRGKFRPSQIYSIPQLQDFLQHAQSALGTGLVSASTNRK